LPRRKRLGGEKGKGSEGERQVRLISAALGNLGLGEWERDYVHQKVLKKNNFREGLSNTENIN
jgi:hypothetical protein